MSRVVSLCRSDCAMTVRTAIKGMLGVRFAKIDSAQKTAIVAYDDTCIGVNQYAEDALIAGCARNDGHGRTAINDHLPAMRPLGDRNDADRRMSVSLRVQAVRFSDEAQEG